MYEVVGRPVSPILLLATASVLAGIALWFRFRSGVRGEIGLWFLLWLLAAALSAVFSAVSWWVGDRTVSLSFFQATSVLMVASAFFVFLFARSFGRNVDYRAYFWSLPLQLAAAAALANGHSMFSRRSRAWVLDNSSPAAWIVAAALLIYSLLAIYYIAVLLRELRREGHGEEAQRMGVILAALLILFYANVLGGILGARGWWEARVPLVELADLAGALVLAWGVAGRRWNRSESTESME
ncbi:MAG: hypothetical protein QME84_11275 [Actinomycetota bacterium]|nr:hypothetical protein [Actinomycetota bacterium]